MDNFPFLPPIFLQPPPPPFSSLFILSLALQNFEGMELDRSRWKDAEDSLMWLEAPTVCFSVINHCYTLLGAYYN